MAENSATFKLDSAVLSQSLSAINKIAPPFNGCINISIDKGNLVFESRSELSIIFVTVPTINIQGSAKFGIQYDSLKSACSGRKSELDFIYKNTVFTVKAPRYKTELATVDYSEYNPPKEVDGHTIEVSTETSTWLKSAISSVALTPNLISPIMPVSVCINDEGSLIACYARDHIAFIQSPEVKGDIEFSIPVEHASAVFSVFEKSSFKLTATEAFVKAQNDVYTVYMSLPSTDAYMPLDILRPRIEAFISAEAPTIIADASELFTFFGNCKSLTTKERGELIIECNTDKTVISKTSAGGNSKLLLNPNSDKTSLKLKIDEEYFVEAIAKHGKNGEVEIKCQEEQGFVVIPTKKEAYSVIALNH